ncbi:MAG: hypothetical protein R3A79_18695 [Nannocystaceae bacterium]
MAPAADAVDRWARRHALIAGVGTLVFVALFVAAAALYPGGTWMRRSAPGHSLFANYLCDLMQARALNGEPAGLGATLARLGAVAMFVALASFYHLVARLAPRSSARGRFVRYVGLFASVVSLTVPLFPSDRFRVLHILAVVGSFAPAFAATIPAAQISLRAAGASAWIKGAALVTLIAGGLDGLLYAYAYGTYAVGVITPWEIRRELEWLMPALQRVASLGLVAWVLAAVARRPAWTPS